MANRTNRPISFELGNLGIGFALENQTRDSMPMPISTSRPSASVYT